MKLDVPVYFSQGLSARANQYYKLFISWTSQKIKETFLEKNMFEFRHIQVIVSYSDVPLYQQPYTFAYTAV